MTPIVELRISADDAARALALGSKNLSRGIRIALQRPPTAGPAVLDESPDRRVRVRWAVETAALAAAWQSARKLALRSDAVSAALRAALPNPADARCAERVERQWLDVYGVVAAAAQAHFGCSARTAEDFAWKAVQKGWLTGELPKKDQRGE